MTVICSPNFPSSKRLLEAARRAAARALLASLMRYSPFPSRWHRRASRASPQPHPRRHVHRRRRHGALAYALEYYSAVINYPYNSGGRPFDAWPAFMLVPFATGILLRRLSVSRHS